MSYKNRGDSNRSATAAEAGVTESKRSADAAERSAEDAKRSADAAEETARLERAARHDLYAPARPPAVSTRLQAASHAGGTLFGEITVQRDYRVSATGRFRPGATHEIIHSRLIRAGVPESFPIETWSPDRTIRRRPRSSSGSARRQRRTTPNLGHARAARRRTIPPGIGGSWFPSRHRRPRLPGVRQGRNDCVDS